MIGKKQGVLGDRASYGMGMQTGIFDRYIAVFR